MSRPLRSNGPGVFYHLIARFLNREWFIQDDEDRACYLRLLGRALGECQWRCVAYAIMSSHIHLGLIAGCERLGTWVTRVHTPFAQWVNTKYDRIGNVFTRGPKDYAVLPVNEGNVTAYIHNNPVRAGVVARARQSSWTSHRAYAGLVEPPSWLHLQEGLARSGFDGEGALFDQWVDVTECDSGIVELSEARRNARRRGAIEVATPTGGKTPVIPLVARPWAVIRHDPQRLVEITADALGLPVALLRSRRRLPAIIAARGVAVRCGRLLGLTATDVGAALGITQQGAAKIERRAFDRALQPLCTAIVERMEMPSRESRTIMQ
ncbi:MAG: transposase [Deltaproteobacteria bacterium]|nr:transposase [Deltaproteobacteria bacterium]